MPKPEPAAQGVANDPGNDDSVIDARSMTVVRRVEAGASPWGVAIGK